MRLLPFIAICALALPGAAAAQEDAVARLEGTLAKARSSGAVTLAHRESSIPFSYLSARGEPIGYSIDLCRRLVDAMSEAIGRELQVKWLAVTSDTRMDAIVSGRADLECGSTTSNLERARTVAFSPTIFVSGTKLMVKRGSPVRSFRDLHDKTVVATAGTTNEQAMRQVGKRFSVEYKVLLARDHAESFAELAQGRADAFASDDVLLYGLLASGDARGKYDVVGDFLSYDPYGIMFRKGDPQLARLVNTTFRALAEEGELERVYKRWFLQKLPSGGGSIDLPMSAQLEAIMRAMATRPE